MLSIDSAEDQKAMGDALLEEFAELPATEVKRRTGISDDTVRRWREEGVSTPLREPVKGLLYRWYRLHKETEISTVREAASDYGEGGPDARLDEIMRTESGMDRSAALIDFALAQRALALRDLAAAARIRAELAAGIEGETDRPPRRKAFGRAVEEPGREGGAG